LAAARRNTALGLVLARLVLDLNSRASAAGSRTVSVLVIQVQVLHSFLPPFKFFLADNSLSSRQQAGKRAGLRRWDYDEDEGRWKKEQQYGPSQT
jgi:hypothetical protein